MPLQLQSSLQLFDIVFAIKKFSFCVAFFERILAWKQGISRYVNSPALSGCHPHFETVTHMKI